MDPLIKLLMEKKQNDVLKILCYAWDILYIEGRSPDVGKRRENLLRLILENELKLNVNVASSTQKDWDISVKIGNEERKYSVKTREGCGIVKVAWNGFPSDEKARKYEFRTPILFIMRQRSDEKNEVKNEVSVFVFEIEDIEHVKKKLGSMFWWIPRNGTNPRGFGLSESAINELINVAKQKGNYVSDTCEPVESYLEEITKAYWNGWYNLVRALALELSNIARTRSTRKYEPRRA
ncbi:MAG: hypothetical protein QXW41_09425 [Fervidicoccaceae archaeon]